MRISSRDRRRAGNVLLLSALMLFAIFAVTALVIDLGLARVTQRQMQGATDSAAREGLRYRDSIPSWFTGSDAYTRMQSDLDVGTGDLADPIYRDKVRRWLARNQINLTYQDVPDSDTEKGVQFGAGPLLQVTGGTGDSYAFQTINTPTDGVIVYKPALQLNTSNKPEGDLVSGSFSGGPSSPTIESADYSRTDFAITGTDAFLVRLRRTNDPRGKQRNPLDNQPGISTTGNALPLIFGQATLIPAAGSDAYSYRRDGITVRGTSIAQGRPVLAVGYPNLVPGLKGAAPLPVSFDFWVDDSIWDKQLDGTWTASINNPTLYEFSATKIVFVGLSLDEIPQIPIRDLTLEEVYVPLTKETRIVAFGYATMTRTGSTLQITKSKSRIAAENATASAAALASVDFDIAAVFKDMQENRDQLLLAPALVR